MKKNEEKLIDLDLGARILSVDKKLAKCMIEIMLKSFFSNEKKLLEKAYRQKKLDRLVFIVDKLRGGLFYCGTPRLHTISEILDKALKAGKIERIDTLYKQFVSAVTDTRKAIENVR